MEENGYFIIARDAYMKNRFHQALAIAEDCLQIDQNLCFYKLLGCVAGYSLSLEDHNHHWHFIMKKDFSQ